jgi:large subunit ribosomal protein L29
MTTAAEYRQMETPELLGKLEEKREELFRLRLSFTAGSLANPDQMRLARHDIARMLTILREREHALEIARQEEQQEEQEEQPQEQQAGKEASDAQ